MKILTKLAVLALICFASCKAPMYVMGMNEQEFIKHNNVNVVEQTEHYAIYKKTNYPFGAPAVTKFFYFVDGKLVRMDTGERMPDFIIEHRSR
jgi:hypothetical protein